MENKTKESVLEISCGLGKSSLKTQRLIFTEDSKIEMFLLGH